MRDMKNGQEYNDGNYCDFVLIYLSVECLVVGFMIFGHAMAKSTIINNSINVNVREKNPSGLQEIVLVTE